MADVFRKRMGPLDVRYGGYKRITFYTITAYLGNNEISHLTLSLYFQTIDLRNAPNASTVGEKRGYWDCFTSIQYRSSAIIATLVINKWT